MPIHFYLRVPLASIALAASVWASSPAAPAEEKRSEVSINRAYKIDAMLVNVDVMVTDDNGRALTGLKRGNFRILDNGIPQKIVDFSPTSAPITIVVLME